MLSLPEAINYWFLNSLPTTLILVAGGQGLRMGAAIPKQFLPLQGKPVLYYAARTFLDTFPDIKIILVLPFEHISYGNIFLQAFDQRIDLEIVAGGLTRFHSVQNGLRETDENSIVFIHDGVRPFITSELITSCYAQALELGSAIPATVVTDSIRQWNGHRFTAIKREHLRSVQTPQTFRASLIKQAFEQEYDEAFTDEATVLERNGGEAHLIDGLKSNIKITSPEDLVVAEAFLQQLNPE
ncbi:MAG: 2-C-methyl-D-erythritol 4-phosphate cytidylyltransferase [Sphingobacteriales bacterium]|nr:MAG: 2-C-methyl-D-erythritol 4-phosphate cytidylyltransferase [Sphingobacteriales bacterium]